MPKKIKLTRLELKRQRDNLARFERFLPTLKLKQQQIQIAVRQAQAQQRQQAKEAEAARAKYRAYAAVAADVAGVDFEALSTPEEVRTDTGNIAGVAFPIFKEAVFPKVDYSLFGTPSWVDGALIDLRAIAETEARLKVLDEELAALDRELVRVTQRVNLFEKVKIPDTREAIRRIRIQLGDEMTAAVVRAKIAKDKLLEKEHAQMPESETTESVT